jgi:hypothetical protein
MLNRIRAQLDRLTGLVLVSVMALCIVTVAAPCAMALSLNEPAEMSGPSADGCGATVAIDSIDLPPDCVHCEESAPAEPDHCVAMTACLDAIASITALTEPSFDRHFEIRSWSGDLPGTQIAVAADTAAPAAPPRYRLTIHYCRFLI